MVLQASVLWRNIDWLLFVKFLLQHCECVNRYILTPKWCGSICVLNFLKIMTFVRLVKNTGTPLVLYHPKWHQWCHRTYVRKLSIAKRTNRHFQGCPTASHYQISKRTAAMDISNVITKNDYRINFGSCRVRGFVNVNYD